jgi:hypothetical protein
VLSLRLARRRAADADRQSASAFFRLGQNPARGSENKKAAGHSKSGRFFYSVIRPSPTLKSLEIYRRVANRIPAFRQNIAIQLIA